MQTPAPMEQPIPDPIPYPPSKETPPDPAHLRNPTVLPARQANISQHLAVLRHARLVDYVQEGSLRCYSLCRPRLVEDMLALVGRDDPVVQRTPEEIQADKERLAKTKAASAASVKKARKLRKTAR